MTPRQIAAELAPTLASCEEALRGDWDRSDEGFEAMRDSLADLIDKVGEGYNGWSNYDTWALHLHLTNDEGSYRYWAERARWWQGQPSTSEYWTPAQSARFNLADELAEHYEEVTQEATEQIGAESIRLLVADLLPRRGDIEFDEIARAFLDD